MSENSMPSAIKVRKKTGELVPFDVTKLERALKRSGASEKDIALVRERVLDELHEGMTTRKIYQVAYRMLKKISKRTAGRYRLKKAIFELGPSGFPFEHFVAKLLEQDGYHISTGNIIAGKCVDHEVDVVAKKGNELLMAECKYHRAESTKSDVKISMYVESRYRDIENRLREEEDTRGKRFSAMLITNTRFTTQALDYGRCTGLKLVSWDQPEGNSLRDWIDRSGLHPLTSLKSMTKKEKQRLLESGTVLCREILANPAILDSIPVNEKKKKRILHEVEELV
jgi:Holliday junction resolvase-like predicted endonuclease